jgi:hypothetical protein
MTPKWQVGKEPWVYYDQNAGFQVYRASVIGGCIRSLVAARLGESPFPLHANLRKSLDASGGLEDETIRRFTIEMASSDVIWRQKMVELVVPTPNCEYEQVIVRGRIDGMYQLDDSILEVKNFGDNYFEKWHDGYNRGGVLEGLDVLPGFLGQKYRVQGGIYGHAAERKVRYVIGHKVKKLGDEDLVTGVTDETWVIEEIDISPPIVPNDLYPLADLHARIQFIEECAANDELPECDQNCREGDPYGESHFFAGPKKGDDDDLSKMIRMDELRELLGSKGEDDGTKRWGLLGEYEDLKDYFKNSYGNQQHTEKVTAGPFTASVVPYKGRMTVDAKWLKKSHPDIYDQSLKPGRPYFMVTVKKAKSEQGEE